MKSCDLIEQIRRDAVHQFMQWLNHEKHWTVCEDVKLGKQDGPIYRTAGAAGQIEEEFFS